MDGEQRRPLWIGNNANPASDAFTVNNMGQMTASSYSTPQGTITPQICATGSVTPATTVGGTATGTCTISVSATGGAGVAKAMDGSVQGICVRQVTVSRTTATVTLATIIAGSPTAKSYNVTVL